MKETQQIHWLGFMIPHPELENPYIKLPTISVSEQLGLQVKVPPVKHTLKGEKHCSTS